MVTPVFIGGTGRSGTTVMKQALAKHRAVAQIAVELRFIVDPGGLLDLADTLVSKWTPQSADIAIQRFERLILRLQGTPHVPMLSKLSERFGWSRSPYGNSNLQRHFSPNHFELSFNRFSERLGYFKTPGKWSGTEINRHNPHIVHASPVKAEDFQRIANDLMAELFAADIHACWIDDTPFCFLRAVEIFQLFPNAKILHVYRHPLDVLASHLKRDWAGKDALAIAHRISDILDYWKTVKAHIGPNFSNLKEVSLESIVNDTEHKVGEIVGFLELDHATNSDIASVFTEFDANIDRWRDELPLETIEVCRPLLEHHIIELGYG